MMRSALYTLLGALALILFACQPNGPGNTTGTSTAGETNTGTKPPPKRVDVSFNEDSAYYFVEKQVSFGPRVPGTAAHGRCVNFLNEKLAEYCDTAFVQQGTFRTMSGNIVPINNPIGIFNAESKKRILLGAHFDTRPYADEDPERPTEPSDGANDGASGVGALLEIARQLKDLDLGLGIDIIFFDAEDMGSRGGHPATWCLGSQYWSGNLHVADYFAQEGILLDMVGAKDAIFAYEVNSIRVNPGLVREVWTTGQQLGYGKHFLNINGGAVIDDHQFVQTQTGIPMIDIIEHDLSTGSFGDYWHTHKDNMDVIDAATLKAVGHTVLQVIANRNSGI